MSQLLFIMLAIVIIILLSALLRDRNKAVTTSEFFLHGQNLRLGSLTSTLVSTNLSLGNMIYVCAILGYFYGYSGMFWVVATIIALGAGFLLFGWRFREYIEDKGNFGTLHDFLATKHSAGDPRKAKILKTFAALITAAALFIAIVLEAHLGAKFLQIIFPIPLAFLVAAFVVLVAIYTIGAGFYTVVFTDRIQFALMLFAVLGGAALFTTLPQGITFAESGYTTSLESILTDVGWPTSIGLLCLGFFWLIATPDTWQRNAATRNISTSMAGAFWGTLLMCLWVAAFALGGMLVKTSIEPLAASAGVVDQLSGGFFAFNDIFLIDLEQYGFVAMFGGALLATGMVMAAISTIDTFFIVLGHVINVDLSLTNQGVSRLDQLTEDQNRFVKQRGRFFILFSSPFIVGGWFLLGKAGWLNDPLSLFFVTYTLQFVVAIPLLAGTYSRTQNFFATFLAIALSTFITFFVGVWALSNLGNDPSAFGLPASSWLALIPVFPIAFGLAVYIPTAMFSKQ